MTASHDAAPAADAPRLRRRAVWALVLIAACYMGQGLFFARTLLPSGDMVQYLVAGRLAVRGEISLFDDRLPGNRPPLPFYVLGVTQLAGPNLAAARHANIVWGVATLCLTALLAWRLAGPRAGVLAAAFLASQGVVVAYYSNEGYPAFSACCLAAGLLLLLGWDTPRCRLIGMAVVGALFFVRGNLWPAVPLLLVWALAGAASPASRVALVAVVAMQPLVFFASDPRHLKILAYVPLLNRLVAPLGYSSALVLDDRVPLTLTENLWEAARLVRRYEFWVLALVLLLAIDVARWLARRSTASPREGRVGLLWALLAFMLVVHLWMFQLNWKWIGVYFLSFAPIVPVLLGVGYSRLWSLTGPRSWSRRLVVVTLAVLLLPPLYFVRHPLLPVGEARQRDPLGRIHTTAARLRELVPADAQVFLYAWNVGYYLSGLPPTYLQQAYSDWTLPSVRVDDNVVRRSGLVPLSDLERWLSREAGYAVINPTYLAAHDQEFLGATRVMRELLDRHFDRIATVADYPPAVYDVYRRKR